MQRVLPGTWRSYKSFSFNGNIKKDSTTSYTEVTISESAELSIKSLPGYNRQKNFQEEEWEIQTWDKKRYFLFLSGKKAFEVITFESDDLVLLDLVTGEKTFFASLSVWYDRLNPFKETGKDVHLTIWSKTLADFIKL